MGNGPRYKVQTRYGWFSLDEGAYKDYLEGRLTWINWPPPKKSVPDPEQMLPPEVSDEAVRLRGMAETQGVLRVLEGYALRPKAPCGEKLKGLDIEELCLSVRASNGLRRAGVHTFGDLKHLADIEGGLFRIRNLGIKSVKEIENAFLAECYSRLLPYEKAVFWQEALESVAP